MKIKSAVFEKSAPSLAASPAWALPEFAFIGRSNVGKSSLINLLSETKNLAKASVTPGKTQLINFFRFNTNWCLVDLPGYGYARVNKEQRADFNIAVANFIEKRDNLIHVFVLIDSRLAPQRIDLEFLRWIVSADISFSLVFTKADKQSHSVTQSNVAVFKQAITDFMPQMPPTFISSSTTKAGRLELLEFIDAELKKAKQSA